MICQVRVTSGDHKNPTVKVADFDDETKAVTCMAVLATQPDVLTLEFICDDEVQFEVVLHNP